MHKRLVLFGSLVSLVGMASLVLFTSPSEAGPFGMLVFFVLFYVLMFSASSIVISVYRKIAGGIETKKQGDFLYAAVIGFGPVLLLLMRAFEVSDVFALFLTILFIMLGCFLVKNRFNVIQ